VSVLPTATHLEGANTKTLSELFIPIIKTLHSMMSHKQVTLVQNRNTKATERNSIGHTEVL